MTKLCIENVALVYTYKIKDVSRYFKVSFQRKFFSILNILKFCLPSNRFCVQSKLNAVTLIFIQFTILILLFTLVLKGHDHKTHKYVHHKKCNDNNIDNIKYRDYWPIIDRRSLIFSP